MRFVAVVLGPALLATGVGAVECAPATVDGPRLAIIVDDFGYSMSETVKAFVELEAGITLTVIPALPYSERVAGEAVRHGKGLLAHLPMEPIEYPDEDPGPEAIFTSDRDEEIRAKVRRWLDRFDRLDGANNHMGSRAMLDERVVRIVLEEVARRDLFFIDSQTIAGHLARHLAGPLGVACLENDLFWDTGYDEKDEILRKLDRLAEIAIRRGYAVGIGHPRAVTLEALSEKLPEFERLGISLVRAAELVRRPARHPIRSSAPERGRGPGVSGAAPADSS